MNCKRRKEAELAELHGQAMSPSVARLSGMKTVLMDSRQRQAPEAGYLHSEGVCHGDVQDSMSHDGVLRWLCVKTVLGLYLDRAAAVTCRDGV